MFDASLTPKPPRICEIQQVLCDDHDISLEDMRSECRKRAFAWPRQIAMFLARDMTDASYPQIGARFGSRDHTTVLFAYRKIKARVESDQKLADLLCNYRLKIAAVVSDRIATTRPATMADEVAEANEAITGPAPPPSLRWAERNKRIPPRQREDHTAWMALGGSLEEARAL